MQGKNSKQIRFMLLSRLILLITMTLSCTLGFGQGLARAFKFATFYTAVNGGNSIADEDVWSVTHNGLQNEIIETPFDYAVTFGIRKIARFGYENRANVFYDGTETSWSDGANIGKRNGLEFLAEVKYKRQMGQEFLDQNHFLRYVGDKVIVKGEYLQDGFADISYFETSERYRLKLGKKFSLNLGMAQRLSAPYGYDPLAEWLLDNGNLHYTYLALQEGYTIEFDDLGGAEYCDPSGKCVATNSEVWEAVVIPTVISDYVARKRDELNNLFQLSVVAGFDFYHYTDNFWLHSWANIMPYHYNNGNEFMYHNSVDGQWLDYSGGLILGYRINKHLGLFAEGKYNKYWNRRWYNFKCGVNYVIF
jgi:hypothetical protein